MLNTCAEKWHKNLSDAFCRTNLLPDMRYVMFSFLYKNNMAELTEQSVDKIKVTVKTPRDKKEVFVEGNGLIKQVHFDVVRLFTFVFLFT